MPTTFFRSNRLENIVEPLIDTLQQSSEQSLLAVEYCLVQSIGMGRYFALEFAKYNDIFANFKFLYPNKFLQTLINHLNINKRTLNKSDMSWLIYDILSSDHTIEELHQYTKNADPLKIFTFASSLADTFDQYILSRPQMVRFWDQGEAIYIQGDTQHELEQKDMWQFELWHLVFSKEYTHRAEVQHLLLNSITSRDDIPFARLSILGVSTLSPFFLDVVQKISQFIPVYMGLLSPTAEYYEDMINKSSKKIGVQLVERASDYYFEGNSLLASCGMLGQEFGFMLLNKFENEYDSDPILFNQSHPETIIQTIQHDIQHLKYREQNIDDEKDKIVYQSNDRSIQIHGVHSKKREVEILHDHLLDLLNNNEDLELRDILVMTPDINEYAPYISAIFGDKKHQAAASPFLAYSIADLKLKNDAHTIPAFIKIISLHQSRFSVSDIMSLLRFQPIFETAGFHEDDIEQVSVWLYEASFRWGRDKQDRKKLLNVEYEEYSLIYAVKRLLHSYCFSAEFDDTVFENITPSHDFEGNDSLLAGKLISFLDKLESLSRQFEMCCTLASWRTILNELVHTFFSSANSYVESYAQVLQTIYQITESPLHDESPINFEIVAHLLLTHFETEAKAFGFIDGRITFCEMLPMRSIPFKVIAVLGMNESAFPRANSRNTYDLVARYPHKGDRSVKFDDRYLFLETLLSVRRYLYLSYQAFDDKDNSQLHPSPLITEILTYLENNVKDYCSNNFITMHKLQPFAADYFKLNNPNYFTYNREQAHYSEIYNKQIKKTYLFADAPLPKLTQDAVINVDLDDLLVFFNNPFRYFLKKSLNIELPGYNQSLENSEHLSFARFTRTNLLPLLVDELQQEKAMDTFREKLRMDGIIPLKAPGDYSFESIVADARKIKEEISFLTTDSEHTKIIVTTMLTVGTTRYRISAELGNVYASGLITIGDTLSEYEKSRQYSNLWIKHLLLQNAADIKKMSFLVTPEQVISLKPVKNNDQLLTSILELFIQGQSSPLRFDNKSSSLAYSLLQKGNTPESIIVDLLHSLRKQSSIQNNDLTLLNDEQYRKKILFPENEKYFTLEFVENAQRFFQSFNTYCNIPL